MKVSDHLQQTLCNTEGNISKRTRRVLDAQKVVRMYFHRVHYALLLDDIHSMEVITEVTSKRHSHWYLTHIISMTERIPTQRSLSASFV
jgi:hypothetical protein